MSNFLKNRFAHITMLTASVIGVASCSLSPEASTAHRATAHTRRAGAKIFEVVASKDFDSTNCYVGGNANYLVIKTYDKKTGDTTNSLAVQLDRDGSSSVKVEGKDDSGNWSFLNVLDYDKGTDSTLSLSDSLSTSIGTRGDSINTSGEATIDAVIDDAKSSVEIILDEC